MPHRAHPCVMAARAAARHSLVRSAPLTNRRVALFVLVLSRRTVRIRLFRWRKDDFRNGLQRRMLGKVKRRWRFCCEGGAGGAKNSIVWFEKKIYFPTASIIELLF